LELLSKAFIKKRLLVIPKLKKKPTQKHAVGILEITELTTVFYPFSNFILFNSL